MGKFGELEDLGVDGRMLLKSTSRSKHCKGQEWVHLAEDREQVMAVVNIVMNLRFP